MFSPGQRINRITYLAGLVAIPVLILLVQIILGTILGLIPGLQNSLSEPEPGTLTKVTGTVTMVVYFPILFAIGIYFLILVKQRSNDITNRSLLLSLLALISIIGALILAIIPGKKQDNGYGVPPRNGIHLRR